MQKKKVKIKGKDLDSRNIFFIEEEGVDSKTRVDEQDNLDPKEKTWI